MSARRLSSWRDEAAGLELWVCRVRWGILRGGREGRALWRAGAHGWGAVHWAVRVDGDSADGSAVGSGVMDGRRGGSAAAWAATQEQEGGIAEGQRHEQEGDGDSADGSTEGSA